MVYLSQANNGLIKPVHIPRYLVPTIAITAGLTVALAVVFYIFFGENIPISIGYLGTAAPIDIMEPIWLMGLAILPPIFAVAVHSLTDISREQQLLSASVRSIIVAGVFVAAAAVVVIAAAMLFYCLSVTMPSLSGHNRRGSGCPSP